MAEPTRINLPDGTSVSGMWTGEPGAQWTLIYAPGAGSDLRDGFGAHMAQALEEQGIASLRFQFPYAEAKRRTPDRLHFLEGADHSFRAPKRLGRTQSQIWDEAVQAFIDWLPSAGRTTPPQ